MPSRATSAFAIHPIPEPVLQAARAAASEPHRPDAEAVIAEGGEPLRCCLRNATVGETLVLFAYQPALPAGPYQEVGPVFAHARACGGYHADGYPPGWRGRAQVLRAYDAAGRIHESTTTHDGSDPETVIRAVLQDRAVTVVHSRNLAYGCYMFAITRRERHP